MKRLLLLVAATAAVVTLVVTLRPHDQPATATPAVVSPTTSPSTRKTTAPPRYRSGTAIGTSAHTDYGDVRVRVTVAHRRIVKVEPLELPHGNPMDLQLSRPAARTLERRVVEAQSAEVDTVSGATYTSTGYLESLQAALDRLS